MKVLLVNDEEDILQVVADRLEFFGLDVVTARSGDECLSCVAQDMPDLVLLDVHMPGTDGLETLTILQRGSPDLPVIIFSASADPTIVEQAMARGAVDYLIKPFDPAVLKQKMSQALGRPL